MKITYLVPNIDGMGGTSRAVLTQAHALRATHDVEILSVFRTAQRPHYEVPDGVRVRYLSASIPDQPPSTVPPDLLDDDVAARLADRPSLLIPESWDPTLSSLGDTGLEHALPTLRSDILITVTPALLAVAAQLLPSDVALIHQEHRASSERTAGLEPLLAFGPRADAIVLVTGDSRDWLRHQLGDRSPWLDVVPNALPPGYRPVSTRRNPLIVSAGRFVREKQFTHLIRAFASVAHQIPEWRLRIYGSGPYQSRMTRIIRKTRMFDRVELPGVSSSMSIEWANASIAALTSRTEGLPLVVQEAMAAGVPVASYDCPSGPRELVAHEATGLLVPPGSEAGMAAALLRLATDDHLRDAMGTAAQESAAQYEPDRVAGLWERLFEQVMSARSRTGNLPRATGRAVALASRSRTTKPDGAPDAPDTTAHIPMFTPAAARTQVLQCAVRAGEAVAPDEWFVLPEGGPFAPLLVVPDEARRAYLASLPDSTPDYMCLRRPATSGWPDKRGPVSAMADEMADTVPESIILEPWAGPEENPGLLGQRCGVRVEFWVARDGCLWPPKESAYNKPVRRGGPTQARSVNDVCVRTLPETGISVDQCDFPIDVVVTWVDGGDADWAARRDEVLARLGRADRTASGRARFADNGELRYALRSIDLFAPWVRTIHLVTAGQVPAWLDPDHPRIRIVDHAEILPADALPTFNSHSIETALHRVPGLAEHYIYFNDDVFLARPVRPETFFSPDGRPAMFWSDEWIGPDHPDAPMYLQAAHNNRRLLERDFGRTITHTLAHTPHPQHRPLVSEVVDRYAADIDRTARSPFRSSTDLSLTSSLVQHYGLITGRAWRGEARHVLVNRSSPRLKAEVSALLRRELDTFCIADQHDYGNRVERADSIMAAFFEEYFPFRSAWERN